MRTCIAALFTLVSALVQPVAAQQPVGTVAHDYCQMYDWDQGVVCGVFVVAGDGSNSTYVGEGIEPAWSADGARIAFVESSQPSIFVLNLSDWSLAEVPGLTQNIPVLGHPAWSPDGETIAFECEVEPANRDICAIRTDGTGLVRLTSDPAAAAVPRFSVDGSKIGFNNPDWVVINADGTGITTATPDDFALPAGTRTVTVVPYVGACNADGRICPDTIYISNADGTYTPIAYGNNPAWALSSRPIASPVSRECDGQVCTFDGSGSWVADGSTIANYSWNFGDGTMASGRDVSHEYLATGTYTVTLTVMTTAGVTGTRTASVVVAGNRLPAASFTYACSGSQCAFDGSGSSDPDGQLATFFWRFGDGVVAAGATANHRYTAIGTFTVSLVVTDDGGATREQQQTILISSVTNAQPVASPTAACAGLTCTFSGLLSSDPDGTVTKYSWNFGDGTMGDGALVGHTFPAPGTYTVTLSVTDNLGATDTRSQAVTAVRLPIHVSDRDGTSTAAQSKWNATVTISVHESSHAPVAGVVVTGFWNDGSSATCTTTGDGRCAVIKSGLLKTAKASFSISDLSHVTYAYTSGGNHDPDGESNGTAITFTRR